MSESNRLKTLWQKKWLQNLIWVLVFLAIFLVLRPYMQGDVQRGVAPAVEGQNLNGEKISLKDYQGKPTMVHFWATWCPICKLELGAVESVAKDYQVINVATQSGDDQTLLDFAAANDMNPEFILNDYDGELFKQYGAKAVPATFFIDDKGNISTVEVGYTTSIGMRLRLWWLE